MDALVLGSAIEAIRRSPMGIQLIYPTGSIIRPDRSDVFPASVTEVFDHLELNHRVAALRHITHFGGRQNDHVAGRNAVNIQRVAAALDFSQVGDVIAIGIHQLSLIHI